MGLYSKFFNKDDTDITFIGKYMEAYVPVYFFEKGVAEMVGEHFRLIATCNFRIFADTDGTKPLELRTFVLPVWCVSYPSGGYEIKKLDLVEQGEEQYYVLKYYSGDKFCSSRVAQNTPAFSAFLDILMGGKLPKSLNYDVIMELWSASFTANGIKFNIPDVIKEIVVAGIYRDPNDLTTRFGKLIGLDPSHPKTGYSTLNPRQVAKYSSTHAALTFEDFNDMALSSLNTARNGRSEKTSPMEQIMKF